VNVHPRVLGISICNCTNVTLHCFGRTLLQSIPESCKMESASAPQQQILVLRLGIGVCATVMTKSVLKTVNKTP